jgi:hypothetical protein
LNHISQKVPHAHEVIGGGRKAKNPSNVEDSAMAQLTQQRNRFQPAEAFLDSLAFPLADAITNLIANS